MIATISRMMEPLKHRIMLMLARGVVKAINDGGGLQSLQIALLAGELRDGIERVQNYGFTSNPLPGSEAVVAFLGGNRALGLAIAVDDRRFRLKGLGGGEVALYTDEGDKIHFKRGNKIVVYSPNVEIGEEALERVLQGERFQARFNAHKHMGNLGIPTGVPIEPSPDTDLSTEVKTGG